MKNKRSTSTQQLQTVTHNLNNCQNQLRCLKEKIQLSQPILQTIYNKVKRREELYLEKINKNGNSLNISRCLLKQYKHLYEESLQFMKKGNLIDKYSNQHSNYLLKNYHHPKKPIKNQEKPKSIYDQYLERINRTTSHNPHHSQALPGSHQCKLPSHHPQLPSKIENIKKCAQNIADSISKDIQQMKSIRKISQNSMRKSRSAVTFAATKKKVLNEDEVKERLIKLRSQQLSREN